MTQTEIGSPVTPVPSNMPTAPTLCGIPSLNPLTVRVPLDSGSQQELDFSPWTRWLADLFRGGSTSFVRTKDHALIPQRVADALGAQVLFID